MVTLAELASELGIAVEDGDCLVKVADADLINSELPDNEQLSALISFKGALSPKRDYRVIGFKYDRLEHERLYVVRQLESFTEDRRPMLFH